MNKKKNKSIPIKNNNAEYISAVERTEYPTDPRVPLADKFEDQRGVIQNLIFTSLQSVAVITSKQGTERSNHYHRTDWHFLYVLSGEMHYYERDVDQEFPTKFVIVKPGEMVFTAPLQVHKCVFVKDTVLLSLAKNVRSYQLHEEDVVRVEF